MNKNCGTENMCLHYKLDNVALYKLDYMTNMYTVFSPDVSHENIQVR